MITKVRAYAPRLKRYVIGELHTGNKSSHIHPFIGSITSFEVDTATIGRCVGLEDVHGNTIFENHIVEFEYKTNENEILNMKGNFEWNQEELRYGINIINSEARAMGYECLSYDFMNMKKFNIVGDTEISSSVDDILCNM